MFLIDKFAFALSVTGLKSLLQAAFFSASKSCPGGANNSFALVSVIHDSTATRPMFLSRLTNIKVLAPPACRNDFKWITRRARLVNNDGCGGAFLSGDFILVGPAAVVGHRLAFEHLLIELRRILRVRYGRIVDEHDNGLAFHIDTFVIVPAVFRRDNAISDKNDIGVFDLHFGHVAQRTRNVIGRVIQG